jgi:hypothetical protein
MFRPKLEERLLSTNKKNNAGAKPFDIVIMFKILILTLLKKIWLMGSTIFL